MHHLRSLFTTGLLVGLAGLSYSQGFSSTSDYVDPAMNHNRLLKEQNQEGVYKLIGPYKVIGSSYLYGEKHKGDIFSSSEKAYDIIISYNTYNQQVEFYSTGNPDRPLVKEPGELDSFFIRQDTLDEIATDIRFIYGYLIGSGEKSYFQLIESGKRFSVYKRYKSELGIVSSNYVQTELREFDLTFDYFYYDSETKTLKKLKSNLSSIIKEFKSVKDVSSVTNKDLFTVNPEAVLRKVTDFLNN